MSPLATEVCDGQDTDCDGLPDDYDDSLDTTTQSSWFADQDGDGHGDPDSLVQACTAPAGHVSTGDDCNDTRADAHPDAPEVCDDSNPAVHPGASEVCDEHDVDDDYNGLADTDDPGLTAPLYAHWPDDDGDGYGDAAATPTDSCDPPGPGAAAAVTGGDCDDSLSQDHPGATERCSGIDEDCDASTSEAGRVDFIATGGSVTSLTAAWSTGTASTPTTWSSAGAGELHVCAGTWGVGLSLEHDVSVIGHGGAGSVVLDGAQTLRPIEVAPSTQVSIQGLTVHHGRASRGGGVFAEEAELTLHDVWVQDKETTGSGGGVFIIQTQLNATSLHVHDNTGTYGGGLYARGSCTTVHCTDCTFQDNTAIESGGGVRCYDQGVVTLTDVVASHNATDARGGGLGMNGCELYVAGGVLGDNTADADAAGLYSNSHMELTEVDVLSNTSFDDGGGIFVELNNSEWLDVVGGSVLNNTHGDDGGGILARLNSSGATLRLDGVDFSGNTGDDL